jgi:hypothetical protein
VRCGRDERKKLKLKLNPVNFILLSCTPLAASINFFGFIGLAYQGKDIVFRFIIEYILT